MRKGGAAAAGGEQAAFADAEWARAKEVQEVTHKMTPSTFKILGNRQTVVKRLTGSLLEAFIVCGMDSKTAVRNAFQKRR